MTFLFGPILSEITTWFTTPSKPWNYIAITANCFDHNLTNNWLFYKVKVWAGPLKQGLSNSTKMVSNWPLEPVLTHVWWRSQSTLAPKYHTTGTLWYVSRLTPWSFWQSRWSTEQHQTAVAKDPHVRYRRDWCRWKALVSRNLPQTFFLIFGAYSKSYGLNTIMHYRIYSKEVKQQFWCSLMLNNKKLLYP